MEKRFSRTELQRFDGKDGRPAYVSYNGDVYDVTSGPDWVDGKHFDEHPAGVDLTTEMDSAPHGAEVLEGFPKIGIVED